MFVFLLSVFCSVSGRRVSCTLWSVICSEQGSENLGLALMGMYCLTAKMDGETEA